VVPIGNELVTALHGRATRTVQGPTPPRLPACNAMDTVSAALMRHLDLIIAVG
jgi:hypothetical protein